MQSEKYNYRKKQSEHLRYPTCKGALLLTWGSEFKHKTHMVEEEDLACKLDSDLCTLTVSCFHEWTKCKYN